MKKNNFIVLISVILYIYLIYPTIIFETKFFYNIIEKQSFYKHYEILKNLNYLEIGNTIYIYFYTIILFYLLISISEKYNNQSNKTYEEFFYISAYIIFAIYLINDWYDYYNLFVQSKFEFNRVYLYENFVFNRKLNYIWLIIPIIVNNSLRFQKINIIILGLLIINSLITLSRFEVFVALVLLLSISNLKTKLRLLLFIIMFLVVFLRLYFLDLKVIVEHIAWESISYKLAYLYERLLNQNYTYLYSSNILPARALARAGLLDILSDSNKIILLSLIIVISAIYFRIFNFILPSVIAVSFFKAYRGGFVDALNYCLKYILFLVLILLFYKIYIKFKKYYV